MGYLLWEPKQSITNPNCTKATTPGQAPDTAMKTGTGEAILGLSHISTDITAQVGIIHIEAIPDHDIGIITTIPEVDHGVQALHTGVIAINPAVTHHNDHTADCQHTEAHHTTPKIKVTCIHAHPTHPQDGIHIGHTCTPVDHKANHIIRRLLD